MNSQPSSRELAEQVQVDFHSRNRRPLRRRILWLALACGFLAAVWVGSAWRNGRHRVFAAGPVSTAHRMIEDDCRKCHTTWAPLMRLLSFSKSDAMRSIDNNKCLSCHNEAVHHAGQVPGHGHDGLSCADCHDEHRGHNRLARVDDRRCLACHESLVTTRGPTETFVRSVSSFESKDPQPHPEFALKRGPDSEGLLPAPGPRHGVWSVAQAGADEKNRAGQRFRDRTRLRFNHATHLKAGKNARGELVVGLRAKDGQTVDLSRRCEVCHQVDVSGGYMKSIRFETHCRECHPLLFDNRNQPGQQAPHATADLVRGWLTNRYTLAVLEPGKSPVDTAAGPVDPPRRAFPGLPFRGRLDPKQATSVRERVAVAEAGVLQHAHTLFGREAKGGCRFCHEITDGNRPGDWQVVAPEIPDRWMVHSRFRHDSHRTLDCGKCHEGVLQSKQTADVLMPGIAVCRSCHGSKPTQEQFVGSSVGARSDCVECHVYHGRGDDKRPVKQ